MSVHCRLMLLGTTLKRQEALFRRPFVKKKLSGGKWIPDSPPLSSLPEIVSSGAIRVNFSTDQLEVVTVPPPPLPFSPQFFEH